MKLFETLGIKYAGHAAAVALHDYVSNRSVALLLSSRSDEMYIGSGVCVRIADRYLIATAAHNLQDLELSNVSVIGRGERLGQPLQALRMGVSDFPDRDVAWLELDPNGPWPSRLHFVTSDQICSLHEENDRQPCFLQGYPAQRVEKPRNIDQRPFVESDGLLTLSLGPARRRSPRVAAIDIAVEYPPHDGSIDNIGLAPPPGVSGGGLWVFPRFDDHPVWSAEKAKLVGIARGWWKDEREEVASRIECWLELVGTQIPDLHDQIDSILRKIRPESANAAFAHGA